MAFVQLESEIDSAKMKLNSEIKELQDEMRRLEEIEARAKVFRWEIYISLKVEICISFIHFFSIC